MKHFPLKSMILLEREVHPSRCVASGSGGKSGWKKMKAEGVGSCEIRDAFFRRAGVNEKVRRSAETQKNAGVRALVAPRRLKGTVVGFLEG